MPRVSRLPRALPVAYLPTVDMYVPTGTSSCVRILHPDLHSGSLRAHATSAPEPGDLLPLCLPKRQDMRLLPRLGLDHGCLISMGAALVSRSSVCGVAWRKSNWLVARLPFSLIKLEAVGGIAVPVEEYGGSAADKQTNWQQKAI